MSQGRMNVRIFLSEDKYKNYQTTNLKQTVIDFCESRNYTFIDLFHLMDNKFYFYCWSQVDVEEQTQLKFVGDINKKV